MGEGVWIFSGTTQYLHSSQIDRKRETACFRIETATGNQETQKMAGKRGHIYITNNVKMWKEQKGGTRAAGDCATDVLTTF